MIRLLDRSSLNVSRFGVSTLSFYPKLTGVKGSAFQYGGLQIPPGYRARTSGFCEIPVTIADSLDGFQVNVIFSAKHRHDLYFDIGERAENPVVFEVEKEPEKHILADQEFTMTCGTQVNYTLVIQNARWSEAKNDLPGIKLLTINVQIINNGKAQAVPPMGF